jgi:hypothetical protein
MCPPFTGFGYTAIDGDSSSLTDTFTTEVYGEDRNTPMDAYTLLHTQYCRSIFPEQ